jgi:hypothetical protein
VAENVRGEPAEIVRAEGLLSFNHLGPFDALTADAPPDPR